MIQLCPTKRPLAPAAQSAEAAGRAVGGKRRGRVSRSELTRRARRILETEPQYLYHPSFDAPDAESVILGPPPAPPQADRAPRAPKGADFYVAYLYDTTLLSREQEQYWFRRMNYLKFRAHRLRGSLNPTKATRKQVERIEQLEAEALEIRNQIIQANLRLVVSLAKQYAQATNLKLDELLSEGHMGLIRAVEKFDFSRGSKLSTYATWSIINRFLAFMQKEQRQLKRFFAEPSEQINEAPEPDSAGPRSEAAMTRLRRGLLALLDELPERERIIIEQRFGLHDGGRPQTLPELGRRFGVTKERVRQLQVRALSRLRALAAEHRLEPPED